MKNKILTPEEWLLENCKDVDCDRLMERLSDTMWTRNVVQYMKEYAEYIAIEGLIDDCPSDHETLSEKLTPFQKKKI
jgi:hypothetical protein